MEASSLDAPCPTLNEVLLDRVAWRASAPYLLDAGGSRVLTYEDLATEVRERASDLASWGLSSGTRVGLVISDPLTFSSWFLAGLAAGLWIAPLDPSPGPSARANVARRAQALEVAALISDQDATPPSSVRCINLAHEIARGTKVFLGTTTVKVLEPGGVLISSSGTTGTPKIVALRTDQVLRTAVLIARHNRLDVNDRGLSTLPLWHINAQVVGLLSTLVAGASLVLDERFHRTGFWKLVEDGDVTWINAVPAIIARLVSWSEGEVRPSKVRFVRSASAPLAPTLLREFEELTGIPVIQSYGMTEAASQICVNPLEGPRKPGSVGVPVGVGVRVVPESSVSTSPEPMGYVEIKGPTVISSYASAGYEDRFDSEGWLRTGDLGYFDDDGYLFLVGRSDDVINRGGEKLYPLEIENIVAQVCGVAATVVVGVADDVFGQVPVVYVEPADGTVLNSPEELVALVARIRASVNEGLASVYRPVLVRVVEKFSTLATGKILRGPLREGALVIVHEERW